MIDRLLHIHAIKGAGPPRVKTYFAIPIGWISPQLEMISVRLYLPLMIWEIMFGIWLIRTKDLVKAD